MRVLSFASLVVLAACGSGERESGTSRKIPVKAARVVRREISLPVQTSGILSAEAEMRLSFKVGGILSTVRAGEGEGVKKGDVLARLDLSEIDARALQARRAYEKAERDLARIERLFADSVATLEQLQDAGTARDMAASNLRIAEFNLRHSTIHAPSDGRVLKRFVEENEIVSPGMPVFLFGSTGERWIVRVGVTDRDVVRLQLGDSASVMFDAYTGVSFPAVVSEIAEFADPMTGTYELELAVAADGRRLVSGFVARVEITPSKRDSFHILPVEALVGADGDSGFVFVLADDSTKVRKVPVRIEMLLGGEVAASGRLGRPGEDVTVVTEGAPYLTDGSEVEVAP